MLPRPPDNGSSKIKIHQVDMGGWVRVFTDTPGVEPETLAVYLSHALTAWFRERAQLRLRSVVGIAKGGYTSELHAWYEMHVFPDLAQGPAQS